MHAEAIVRSTIDLAGHLELSVIAEGIETEAVLERLGVLGCNGGQGFVISPPLPAEELTAWLLERSPNQRRDRFATTPAGS